jgi:type II secretory pathway pseudopilin PulG
MKPFRKSEVISLVVIFAVLIAVSIPNFIISLRRARDQTRRDDMGVLTHALDEYFSDFKVLPLSSSDGHILDCLSPGIYPVQGKDGKWTVDPVLCNWGTDPFADLFTGKVYVSLLPRDPDYQKGVAYLYFSDGNRYQIYASMEGMDEAEIDPKIIARNLMCGSRVCNIGRSYNVPDDISIEEYDTLLLKKNVKK